MSSAHTLAWSILTALLVVCILFFGLRTNRSKTISLPPVEGAFTFEKNAMAFVKDMTHFRGAAPPSQLTIAFVLKAGSLAQDRFRSILMLHDGTDEHQLIVGQWGDALIVMNGDDYDYTQRRPRLVKSHAVSDLEERFITVTADGNGSRLYIDGVMVHFDNRWQLLVPRSGPQLHMVIGNSVSGKHNWVGSVYGLAIYATAQSKETVRGHFHKWQQTAAFPYDTGKHLMAAYVFNARGAHQFEDLSGNGQPLRVTDQPVVLKKTFLKSPWHGLKPSRSFFVDAVLNFFGFMPLGAVMFIWLKSIRLIPDRGRVLAVIGFCFLLSLGIEISQAWLPTRHSNLLDLALNTCGSWAGIWMPKIGIALRHRTRS